MNDQYKNSYKATAKELVSLSVYNVGYQLCDAGYQWGPGIRDHYLIHYIISGKGTYEVHHEVHSLSAFFFLGYDLIPIQIEAGYLVSNGLLDSSSVIVIDVLAECSALLQSL